MKERVDKQRESRVLIPYFLFFLLFSAVNIVFSCLCFYTSKQALIQRNNLLFSILTAMIWIISYVFSIRFLQKDNKKLLRALTVGYVFFTILLIFIYIGQKIGFFLLIKDPKQLEEFLKRAGWWMPTLYILLQYLQVTILPIPSIVSTLVGVAVFGALKASLYSFIGIFLGSLTAFYLGRKLGKKTVSWIVGKEDLSKWQKKLKGKDKLFLTSMFLLPMFPDDVLCFIAGLSSMSNRYFLIMIAVTRIISILASCYSFEFIPFNTWWGILIWAALFLILLALCVLVYKNADKINEKLKKIKRKKLPRKK